jgi:hypothetical protein
MSTSKMIRVVGALLLLMGIGQAALAQRFQPQRYQWVLLGQTTVDGQRDRDRISIGRAEGRFRSLQLRVTGGPVDFHRVIVNYANGGSEEVEVRENLRSGGQTRPIDLRGTDRVVNSVDFLYGKGTWRPGVRPKVTLYGVKFTPPRPGPWALLGQTTVSGQRDRDRITIGRSEGRFNSLQLRVTGAPVEFYRVVVNYGDGTSEELEVRENIRPGGQTRSLDLRGRERVVNSVDFFYGKGTWRPSALPRVSLYGR